MSWWILITRWGKIESWGWFLKPVDTWGIHVTEIKSIFLFYLNGGKLFSMGEIRGYYLDSFFLMIIFFGFNQGWEPIFIISKARCARIKRLARSHQDEKTLGNISQCEFTALGVLNCDTSVDVTIQPLEWHPPPPVLFNQGELGRVFSLEK